MSTFDSFKQVSDTKKKQYAFAISSVIMIGVIGIWAGTLPARFAQPAAVQEAPAVQPISEAAGRAQVESILNGSSNGVQIIDSTTTAPLNGSY